MRFLQLRCLKPLTTKDHILLTLYKTGMKETGQFRNHDFKLGLRLRLRLMLRPCVLRTVPKTHGFQYN